MKYCYDYPRPALTADCVVFAPGADDVHVLLIERGREPYQGSWALPGGFMEMDETVEECAARELEEETGLSGVSLEQIGAFSAVDRDPRGRTVTIAFWTLVDRDSVSPRAADDAKETRWFPLQQLPALAFDHGDIITRAVLCAVRSKKLEPFRLYLESKNLLDKSEL